MKRFDVKLSPDEILIIRAALVEVKGGGPTLDEFTVREHFYNKYGDTFNIPKYQQLVVRLSQIHKRACRAAHHKSRHSGVM